jgi:hypothetical protein
MDMSRGRSFFVGLAMVLVGAVSLFGCKAKAGGKCKLEGQEQCTDKSSALLCQSATWKVAPCRGPKGCATLGTETDCDQSLARPTEVCDLEGNLVCADDKKGSLICKGGEWQPNEVCGGPKGCVVSAGQVECDKETDKCAREGQSVCSQDRRTRLACKGGKFGVAEQCKGPNSCRIVNNKVDCDDSLGALGDLCSPEDTHACSLDAKSILICKNGKFATDEVCKHGTCKVEGKQVGCSGQ